MKCSGCVQTAFFSTEAVTEGDHISPHVARNGRLPLAAPTWPSSSLACRLTSRQGPWCHEVSIFYGKHVSCYKAVQAYLRDAVGSTPDHHNKASHINFFGFLVYMIVTYTLYNSLIVKYVIVLNLKKVYALNKLYETKSYNSDIKDHRSHVTITNMIIMKKLETL